MREQTLGAILVWVVIARGLWQGWRAGSELLGGEPAPSAGEVAGEVRPYDPDTDIIEF